MGLALTVLAFIVALGPLVALHEWGHFYVARRCGVKVLAYSIGFGPVLWSRIDKSGTEYRLSAVPLGGYVKMLDEREAEVPEHEKHLAFNNKSAWQKIAIVAAGPLMNFLVAALLFFVLALPAKQVLVTKVSKVVPDTPAAGLIEPGDLIVAVDQDPVSDWSAVSRKLIARMGETGEVVLTVQRSGTTTEVEVPVQRFMRDNAEGDPLATFGVLPYQPPIRPEVATLDPDGAAANAGVKRGDLIVAVDSNPVSDWSEVTASIAASDFKPITLGIQRGAETLDLQVTPGSRRSAGATKTPYLGVGVDPGQIEFAPEYLATQKLGVFGAMAEGVKQTYELSALTLSGMWKMLKGMIGLENISGPVTIANIAGQTMNMGWQPFIGFIGFMSVALAVLNLLPVPVLDGGHIVIHAAEGLMGRPVPEALLARVTMLGMAAVLSLMVLALYNDFTRLF